MSCSSGCLWKGLVFSHIRSICTFRIVFVHHMYTISTLIKKMVFPSAFSYAYINLKRFVLNFVYFCMPCINFYLTCSLWSMEEDQPLLAWPWCLCFFLMDGLDMSCKLLCLFFFLITIMWASLFAGSVLKN